MILVVVIGNIVVIVCVGLMKCLGEKKSELIGNGVFVKIKGGDGILEDINIKKLVDFLLMGVGFLIVCSFFIFGGLVYKFLGILGLVLMIVVVMLVKCL